MKVRAMRDFVLTLSERIREAVAPRRPHGQSLLIVAAAFIGLAAMVGLAVDGGILFVSQAHLRRAVDAAAVAAATQMRVGQSPDAIQRYAYQFIKMNGVDPTTVLVSLYNYNNGESMGNDCHHAGSNQVDQNYDKYGLCGVPQRKLIRVEGRTMAQFAFMPLVGIYTTTVTASAVSESASVDAVIVMDTSMSMGIQTDSNGDGVPDKVSTPADAADCNAVALADPKNPVGNCKPLMDAKEAAKVFVRRLYPDYDRVAIVNFDFKAHSVVVTDTKPQVEATSPMFSYVRQIANPNPDGLNQGVAATCHDAGGPPNYHAECDDDPSTPLVSESTGIYQAIDSVRLNTDRYPWNDPDPPYNTMGDTVWDPDHFGQWNPLDYTCNWFNWATGSCPGHPSMTKGSPDPSGEHSALSTCTGCGIRVAGNMLKLSGRPSALWIIVFLSDGGVNVSDVPDSTVAGNPILDAGIKVSEYPNGYCGVLSTTMTVTVPGGVSLWKDLCVGKVFTATRECGPYNVGLSTCPPGAHYAEYSSPPYDALDYARDMIDATALRVVCVSKPGEDCLANNGGTSTLYNKNEHPRGATGPAGANLTIYSIGLGSSVAKAGQPVNDAEALLRYMAAVGDDGDRATDPCQGVVSATSCGNYYYAAKGAQLTSVFEDIAKRVFTRLSK